MSTQSVYVMDLHVHAVGLCDRSAWPHMMDLHVHAVGLCDGSACLSSRFTWWICIPTQSVYDMDLRVHGSLHRNCLQIQMPTQEVPLLPVCRLCPTLTPGGAPHHSWPCTKKNGCTIAFRLSDQIVKTETILKDNILSTSCIFYLFK